MFLGQCYTVRQSYLVEIPRRDMTVAVYVTLHVWTPSITKHGATSANRSPLRMRRVFKRGA